ncbi:LysR family transcriptional regulator [Afifella sp. IM 167]|uniref:LysR family transcriptional regulator n=1 Tax=Afifella sp. IM 167 TaxID=2033586 RepID=UPI001CCA6F95|nr:LysR family transcriptional regulator [Afifella sp. IM 167]MBZ8132040.1 LysR family transcriptional regulator [Afifella sp. IM 167]
MTLDQLRIFVAVAERRHVTRAAAALGMTQSAASAAIAALEKRYGAKLFDRVGRGIELTETGRRFLPEARRVLERVNTAQGVLEDIADPARGTVSIAASQTIANYWLPRRLTAYHAAFPGVRLDVVIGNTRQVENAVAEGRADLGLVEGPIQHAELTRRQVDSDRLVLVVGADQPLPPETGPGRIDLRALSWVVREVGSGTRAVLEDLARSDGLSLDELRIFLTLPGNEAVREAVEAGAGATIISEHVVQAAIAAGRLQSVPIDLPPRDFALLRHPDRYTGTATRTLIGYLTSLSN